MEIIAAGAAWNVEGLGGAAWNAVGLEGAAWNVAGLAGAAWNVVGLGAQLTGDTQTSQHSLQIENLSTIVRMESE